MNELHKCIDGRCPAGIDKVREIGLTPQEKRAIFHSILNISGKAREEQEEHLQES